MPVWFTWYIRTTTMGSSAKTFRESTALGMTVWRGIEERREDKTGLWALRAKCIKTTTRALVHSMERNCVDSIRLRTEEEEKEEGKSWSRDWRYSVCKGKKQLSQKYEFEEAERGREEEWWGCLLALLPAQRWYMGEGVGSGRKQNTTDQSACSYWFHTSSTNQLQSTQYQARLARRKGTHGSFLVSTTRVCFSLCCSQPWGLKWCDLYSTRDRTDTYACTYVYTYVHMYVH